MKRGKWQQKSFFLFFALCIVFSSFGTAFAADGQPGKREPGQDIAGHWAEPVLKDWLGKGWLSGFQDGTVKPNGEVTRAEFVTLVNKSQGLAEQATIAFKDVKQGSWYYADVAKAEKAGYISGYGDQTFKPASPITRQEAAVILTRLLKLTESGSAAQLSDAQNAQAWSKGAIGAVIDAGLMTADKGRFRPSDDLTRAEAVTLLDRAVQYHAETPPAVTYDKAGEYGDKSTASTVYGSALISAPGVTLNNIVIEGDLVIGEAVGEGDVYLNHVTVKGKTTVLGGGKNSVHLVDSVLLTVFVNKKDGSIRIVAEGSTSVQQITLQSGVRLEESQLTGSGFGDLVLSEAIPSGAQVSLAGQFDSIDVIATSIKIDLTQGAIQQLNVAASAAGSDIHIAASASVASLILNAAANVTGQGSIGSATINASGSSIEQQPGRVTVGSGVNATIGGRPASNTAPGGSSGGSPSIPATVYGFSGTIRDVANQPVADMRIDFRRGVDAREGEVVATVYTNANGEYFAQLPPGIYLGELIKDGFITTYVTGASLSDGVSSGWDATAIRVPASGEIRIVLTWGENPRDEDSHLLGPAPGGGSFHTWYGGREFSVNDTVYADLDHDDVTSYGPETTTVRIRTDGFYQFYVHHYSGISTLRQSGAKVEVYVGDTTEPAKVYNIPTGEGDEIYWDVFGMNIRDGQAEFVDRNTMTNQEPHYEGATTSVSAAGELNKLQASTLMNAVSVGSTTYLPTSAPLSEGTVLRLSGLSLLSASSVTYSTYVGVNDAGNGLVLNHLNTAGEELDFQVTATVTVGDQSASKTVVIYVPTVQSLLEMLIQEADSIIDNPPAGQDISELEALVNQGTAISPDASIDDYVSCVQSLRAAIDRIYQQPNV